MHRSIDSTPWRPRARFAGAAALSFAMFALVTGCAAPSTASTTGPSPAPSAPAESDAGVAATAPSSLPAASSEPLTSDRAVVRVAGLACPKCASNVDVQLERIAGVHVENIDMKHGWVFVRFDREPRPSPARLGRAVEDAGLTYLGVAPGGAAGILPAPIATTGG